MSEIISRRLVLGGLASTTALLTACGRSAQAPADKVRPNFVFIMADDLGYADLSSYGRRDYSTPNIDKLATGGLKLTSAYSNSPVCSATRTALITGNYQYRYRVGLEEPLALGYFGLEPGLPTIASELKQAGYQTALVGKWHLGDLPDYGPLKSGYDHFYGIHTGGVDYFSQEGFGKADLWDGEVPSEDVGYTTDLLGERAIEQLQDFAKSDAPFLLSLHFTAPHWPWEGNDAEGKVESNRIAESSNPFALVHFDGGSLATYAAMVKELDKQVGRVTETLERLGLSENTVIVFTSDNGGERFSDTWPFSGRKTEVLEGGIRVPGIVYWPGTIEAGRTSDVPVMSMDWMPTFLSLAGAEYDTEKFDGTDVSMVLIEDGALLERPLFWRFKFMDQKAVRLGKYKYVQINGHEFLFDVVADPLERGNLKARKPEIFADLRGLYEAWDASMMAYPEDSFSHGLDGAQIADRYATEPMMPPEGLVE